MVFLIIDDDKFKIEMVESFLTEHTIAITKSYNSGMRTIIAGGIDGVILDMGFPKFDNTEIKNDMGLLVLSEMKRHGINIPVIIHSGNYFNVKEFDNVIDYVMTGREDHLQHAISRLIKKCEE